MTTLSSARQTALRRGPSDLGRVYDIASGSTTTVVVTALATGGFSPQRWVDHFLLRPDCASAADRVRRCTNFASSSGTLTHTNNYSDTTFTSEKVELHKFDPYLFDNALNNALGQIRRLQVEEVPVTTNTGRVYLHDLPLLKHTREIERIEWSTSPQLSRNRYFDRYNSYSSGVLVPDYWSVSGSGATMARTTTNARRKYALGVTRATNNVTVTQSVGLLSADVSTADLAGETVTVVLVGLASDANLLRIGVDDGVTQTYSDYHTGGGTYEELTKEVTLSSSATKCDVIIEVNGADATAYIDQAYLIFGQMSDNVRFDSWSKELVYRREYNQTTDFPTYLTPRARGMYLISVERQYPQFDQTRIDAGTADDDETDAPELILAIGGIANLYEKLSQVENADTQKEAITAGFFRDKFAQLVLSHLYGQGTEHGAKRMRGRQWFGRTRSYGRW